MRIEFPKVVEILIWTITAYYLTEVAANIMWIIHW